VRCGPGRPPALAGRAPSRVPVAAPAGGPRRLKHIEPRSRTSSTEVSRPGPAGDSTAAASVADAPAGVVLAEPQHVAYDCGSSVEVDLYAAGVVESASAGRE
jgi:hypothetical protein